jgi:hypothetical protein
LDGSAAKNDSLIRLLVPIARGLAASGNAITVADLREEAVRRGILTGREQARQLSFLGAVMRRAKLRPLDTWRRSHLDVSHGNLNREWGL